MQWNTNLCFNDLQKRRLESSIITLTKTRSLFLSTRLLSLTSTFNFMIWKYLSNILKFISAQNKTHLKFINFKLTSLITCLLLYWPKIHRIFVHFSLFWHWVRFFLFSSIKIITIRHKNTQKKKKKERQTFRPHMGALFTFAFLSSSFFEYFCV